MKSPETRMPCILVADDQPDVLEALRFLIKGEGYQAVLVNSPTAALGQVESRDFQSRPSEEAEAMLLSLIHI